MDERRDFTEGVAGEIKKFFCKIVVYFEKGRKGLVHYSKVLTIKSDISLLKNDRRVLLRKVGEEAYKAIKEGRIDLPESKVTLERIERIDNAIKEKTGEIEKIEKEEASPIIEKEIKETGEIEKREEPLTEEPPKSAEKITAGTKKKTKRATVRKTAKKKVAEKKVKEEEAEKS
jgi:hypothetical protein